MQNQTVPELEASLGESIKALRLEKNIDQRTLAERAGISPGALKNLESGSGSTLRTLISVLRVLGRQDWLNTVAPIATINPLTMVRNAEPRQRASGRRKRLLLTQDSRASTETG